MKFLFAYLVFTIIFGFTAQATVHTVNVEDFEFSPADVTVSVGDTVKWVWDDSAGPHTTTSTTIPPGAVAWNQPINQSSQTFSYIVAVAGSYTYICTIHTNMIGHITATGASDVETIAGQPALIVNNSIAGELFVHFNLKRASSVDIQLIDMSGRSVKNLLSSFNAPGAYSETWFLEYLPDGIYFLVLKTSEGLVSRKVVLE